MKQEYKRILSPAEMCRYKTIWMMGLPGAGKTFIARWLCQQYRWFTHFCIGDLVRAHHSDKADVGFAPPELNGEIEKWFNEAVRLNYDGLIVDSAPRNLEQIPWMARRPDPVIVYVNCDDETRKTHLMHRAAHTDRKNEFQPMQDQLNDLLRLMEMASTRFDVRILEVRN
jgi:adenylylsulfate kinase-like enzyme